MIVTKDDGTKEILCDWTYHGPVCEGKPVVIIITETYDHIEGMDEAIEAPVFVCEEHRGEMMHEIRSERSAGDPVWAVDLATRHAWMGPVEIERIQ
jgi:hypothetical protein